MSKGRAFALLDDTPAASYAPVYRHLGQLREEFHKIGRFDDSNAKLDEVVKLFATYLAVKLGDIAAFPAPGAAAGTLSVEALQRSFQRASAMPYYRRNDGASIFGSSPTLALRESDGPLAARLVGLVVRAVDDAFRQQELGNPYDVLNEAFGHFVRDNFRGNIEDAQYLTPAEAVDLMADIAVEDIRNQGLSLRPGSFIAADPCCGVGSFLTTFAAKYRSAFGESAPSLSLHGQDKVERMVRLTTVNLTLFKILSHSVTIGNSLYLGSPLDTLNGKVDVILTNPPFGARFNQQEIAFLAAGNTPFFSALRQTQASIESELLFIDRDLELLREGGLLLIVVPDSVISAAGLPALLRHHLRSVATLRGVIELPSVTFAQAGTRTKTAVLYLQKGTHRRKSVFMAVSADLGFQVCSRKGVQIKVERGANDLPQVLEAYRKMKSASDHRTAEVLSEAPSAVRVPSDALDSSWTPGHYQAKRMNVLQALQRSRDVRSTRLADLVDFVADERKQKRYRPGTRFISVLHVISEGVLDISALDQYAPITPGVPVQSGEVLLSRINPRIPRVLVVPDLGNRILCSSEFEVMKPRLGVDPYMLAFLLLSASVQSQIQSLTSGTSASHNRVKTRHLADVLLPIPLPGTTAEKNLKATAGRYKRVLHGLLSNTRRLLALREHELTWLSRHTLE
jgi:hypothetical protein